MILLIATGCAASIVLALALVTSVPPLWRLCWATAVAGGVTPGLGQRGWLAPATAVAAGFFAVLAVALWELVVLAGDTLRSALMRPRR